MSAFDLAAAAVFADANIAADAIWYAGGTGSGVTTRAVIDRPDLRTSFGSATIVSDTVMLSLPRADVDSPAAGDTVTMSGAAYVLQGEPEVDPLRLFWRCEARPQ